MTRTILQTRLVHHLHKKKVFALRWAYEWMLGLQLEKWDLMDAVGKMSCNGWTSRLLDVHSE
jgi:hypothetical protein